MYTLESLPVGLTGSFGADRLRDMLAAVQKGPVGELPVVSEASGPTLVGFPAVGSSEHGLGVFWSRLLVGGVYEPVLWVRPTKGCFVDGTACDWVGFPVVLAAGNYQAFELGYLYQGNALKQEATALSLTAAQLEAALAIAIAGSNPKDTLDDTLNPWSVNPATAKAILAYVAPISTNIQWDASGNADFLHNVQVMGGLTVDGALNANGATLNTLTVTNEGDFGSISVSGDSTVTGNQTVVGYQNTGNYYEQDIAATADMTTAGITMTFGQLRVKDGYLDIVLAMSRTVTGSVQAGFSGYVNLTIPADVGAKIFAASATDDFVSAAPFVGNDYAPCWSKLIKHSNTSIAIYLLGILPEVSGASQLNGRIAFNLLV